jgi:orotate phosphoribosyltransferase
MGEADSDSPEAGQNMNSQAVLDLFRRCAGLLEGHFQLSSGLHSSGYLQSARVLQHPEHAAALGRALAAQVAGFEPGVVLSPALGGVVIGHEVARALGVRALFAERRDGRLTLRRGFRIDPGERVLVVEDVVTTGGSTRETIDVARAEGGAVVGVVAIVNRGEEPVRFDVPFEALVRISVAAYESGECPMCAGGEPVTKPGSRPNSP